jgi:DNA-binding XRE family transcriptional regulator
MRQISGLTQVEFAAHRGLSAKVIKEIERGTGNPTVKTLNQIGTFLAWKWRLCALTKPQPRSHLHPTPT